MIAWMFPGQPLKYSCSMFENGHGSAVAALCREATGFDLCSWDDGGCLPGQQVRLQLYGTAASLQHARILRDTGQQPDLVMEHSLGIYAALAVCGCISERDALEMTARVGCCLATMSRNSSYALGSVIGLALPLVESAAARNGVYLANCNTSRHFLLSGHREAIGPSLAECGAAGAFSVSTFDCDAPLHSPLLEEVATGLKQIFAGYRYQEPEIPLLEHIGQELLTAGRIASFLFDELLGPVYWEKSYHAAIRMGVDRFIEVGSGDSLKKFNRWIESTA